MSFINFKNSRDIIRITEKDKTRLFNFTNNAASDRFIWQVEVVPIISTYLGNMKTR